MSTSQIQARRMSSLYWMLIPMRLFLGVTFFYAGVQKLADPQFFKPTAPGYIGRQIIGFAHGSPLRGFLIQFVVPHSHFFGVLIIAGEQIGRASCRERV